MTTRCAFISLILLMFLASGCASSHITSTPSNAQIYTAFILGEKGRSTGKRTPATLSSTDAGPFYRVRWSDAYSEWKSADHSFGRGHLHFTKPTPESDPVAYDKLIQNIQKSKRSFFSKPLVSYFVLEAPTASKKITCYTPPFPPLKNALEFSLGDVKLHVNHRGNLLNIHMCVPEGNYISMNPNEIKVLSPQKAVLETLEFHLIRINDFSGKRDISPKYLHKLHGASKKFLWFEGHRKVVLQAEFKQNREPIHYVEFPPILINGVEVDVPLMEFRLKAHFTSGAAFFPIYLHF